MFLHHLHHHHSAGLMEGQKRFKYLHLLKSPLFWFQPIIIKVLNHLLLFLAIIVSPLSRTPRSRHLCLVWGGWNAPFASPWIGPSATPSWSCDTTARWRRTPAGSRRRCHRWTCWSCCRRPAGAGWTPHWCRWSLLWPGLLAIVQTGQSQVRKCGWTEHLWWFLASSLVAMPSTTWFSLLSYLIGAGWNRDRGNVVLKSRINLH